MEKHHFMCWVAHIRKPPIMIHHGPVWARPQSVGRVLRRNTRQSGHDKVSGTQFDVKLWTKHRQRQRNKISRKIVGGGRAASAWDDRREM